MILALFISKTGTSNPLKNRISGRVTVSGAGSSRRVIIQKRGTFEYIASTHTDPITGRWELKGLPVLNDGEIIVTIVDDKTNKKARVFDYISEVY